MIHVVTSAARLPVDLDPQRWHVLKTALPMQMKAVLVAQTYEGPGRQALIDFFGQAILQASSFKSRLTLTHIAKDSVRATWDATDGGDTAAADCLPRCLGGRYDYGHVHADWIRARPSIEAAATPPAACYRPTAVPAVTAVGPWHASVAIDAGFKRCPRKKWIGNGMPCTLLCVCCFHRGLYPFVNVYLIFVVAHYRYSRRSFEKRKLERVTLENQCEWLQARNAQVRHQNEVLEQALSEAQHLVQQHDTSFVAGNTTPLGMSLSSP